MNRLISPVLPPPAVTAPALPPATRFVKFGGYMICTRCRYTQEFCGCQKVTPPPPTQGDGDASDLERRVRDCRGGR